MAVRSRLSIETLRKEIVVRVKPGRFTVQQVQHVSTGQAMYPVGVFEPQCNPWVTVRVAEGPLRYLTRENVEGPQVQVVDAVEFGGYFRCFHSFQF
jgi:hypothetical protein